MSTYTATCFAVHRRPPPPAAFPRGRLDPIQKVPRELVAVRVGQNRHRDAVDRHERLHVRLELGEVPVALLQRRGAQAPVEGGGVDHVGVVSDLAEGLYDFAPHEVPGDEPIHRLQAGHRAELDPGRVQARGRIQTHVLHPARAVGEVRARHRGRAPHALAEEVAPACQTAPQLEAAADEARDDDDGVVRGAAGLARRRAGARTAAEGAREVRGAVLEVRRVQRGEAVEEVHGRVEPGGDGVLDAILERVRDRPQGDRAEVHHPAHAEEEERDAAQDDALNRLERARRREVPRRRVARSRATAARRRRGGEIVRSHRRGRPTAGRGRTRGRVAGFLAAALLLPHDARRGRRGEGVVEAEPSAGHDWEGEGEIDPERIVSNRRETARIQLAQVCSHQGLTTIREFRSRGGEPARRGAVARARRARTHSRARVPRLASPRRADPRRTFGRRSRSR